jgi:hypothetical protein
MILNNMLKNTLFIKNFEISLHACGYNHLVPDF